MFETCVSVSCAPRRNKFISSLVYDRSSLAIVLGR